MWAYTLILIGLTGLLAWLEHYPASPMITALGLPGPGADAERRCGTMYRYWWPFPSYGLRIHGPGDLVYEWPERRRRSPRPVPVPTRRVVCTEEPGFASNRDRETVELDLLTRHIGHAQRMWYAKDSASWERARDSIASAMVRLGGRELACGNLRPPRRSPKPDSSAFRDRSQNRPFTIPELRDMRGWTFPGYSTRLIAFRTEDKMREVGWLLQFDGYPNLAPGCDRNAQKRSR
jgi:hypothetical protein